MPGVEEQPHVPGTDIAGEIHHPVQSVDEGILVAVADRLGAQELEAEATTVFGQHLTNGAKARHVPAPVLVEGAFVGAGGDPGGRASAS